MANTIRKTIARRPSRFGSEACQIVTLSADFTDRGAILKLKDEIRRLVPRLDLLIHNAGFAGAANDEARDSILEVNFEAPKTLTHSLLESLESNAPSRIVQVTTRDFPTAIDTCYLLGERRLPPREAYRQSKLALTVFGSLLAARLSGSGVTVNSLHPGIVDSRLLRDLEGEGEANDEGAINDRKGLLRRLRTTLPGSWLSTPAEAAERVIRLANDDDLSETSGAFFDEGQPCTPPILEEAKRVVAKTALGEAWFRSAAKENAAKENRAVAGTRVGSQP